MKRLLAALKVSIALTSLSVSILCAARMVGVLPDSTAATLNGRRALCEAVAVGCSQAVQRGDDAAIAATVRVIADRNKDVLSAAVRRAGGAVTVSVGDHGKHWAGAPATGSTQTHVQVPILLDNRPWGAVEISFAPASGGGVFASYAGPAVRFIVADAVAVFVVFGFYLLFLFSKLGVGPTGGIPDRVRATLDTLVEGVLLLDHDQRIALANRAFADTVGKTPAELEGQSAARLGWIEDGAPVVRTDLPWSRALLQGTRLTGAVLGFNSTKSGLRSLAVNATPILGDDGTRRGVLATFDDLTVVEKKNLQLRRVLDRLKLSREEIREQNDKLKDLATRDPLTSCLNRRAFYEQFEEVWKHAGRHDDRLSCIMLDIDHFKSINDRYGHGVGDLALKEVSGVLRAAARATDLVCRYGGEEFCIVLPGVDLDRAAEAGERFRAAIEARTFAGISATASFGVSTLRLGAADVHGLLNQADLALYAAKRSGRNRVVRFDLMPAGDEPAAAEAPRDAAAPAPARPPAAPAEPDVPVSYHAVTSLVSALAHRDAATAEHSRRVADLCVATARGLMSEHECYLLEIAGLLHDIGKLGVPDAVLQKPGPLTEGEWKLMGAHDRMGVEIIKAAFSSPLLGEFVHTHHARYDGNARDPELPAGEDIRLGARILAIADAYDAMTWDRVYRKRMPREAAFVELRRCAGFQFDPDLVERFIAAVLARGDLAGAAGASRISKRTALRIGLQIEKLAESLDTKDDAQLGEMAARLKATAVDNDIPLIGAAAGRLEAAVAARKDWLEVLRLSSDLLELCRSTQNSYLETYRVDSDPLPPGCEPAASSPHSLTPANWLNGYRPKLQGAAELA